MTGNERNQRVTSMVHQEGRLIVHSASPYNAEPKPSCLRENSVTAQSDFYVRSHGDTPDVDADAFELVVDGLVGRPTTCRSRR